MGGAQCSLQEEQSWLQEDSCWVSREAQEVSPQEAQSLLQLLGLVLLEEQPVSYTHLRAHETVYQIAYAVFCLKKFFFNDTATTEIYTG